MYNCKEKSLNFLTFPIFRSFTNAYTFSSFILFHVFIIADISFIAITHTFSIFRSFTNAYTFPSFILFHVFIIAGISSFAISNFNTFSVIIYLEIVVAFTNISIIRFYNYSIFTTFVTYWLTVHCSQSSNDTKDDKMLHVDNFA